MKYYLFSREEKLGCCIPGLEGRFLEFLGLFKCAYQPCERRDIPAKNVSFSWPNLCRFLLLRLTSESLVCVESQTSTRCLKEGLTSQLGWRLLETWWNGLKLGFPEDAKHTPCSFWGQTIAIRYHKVYIFEHVWTQGKILGQFQGNWHALVPIGGATFDTARSLAPGKK
jgi:hypothetical protein